MHAHGKGLHLGTLVACSAASVMEGSHAGKHGGVTHHHGKIMRMGTNHHSEHSESVDSRSQ
jgi:hypothetical protein